jgi:hypothetical protein
VFARGIARGCPSISCFIRVCPVIQREIPASCI